jgi:hypothetical protein
MRAYRYVRNHAYAQMATNPYAASPLCVALVDPTSGESRRAFYFLGTVPKNVLAAARRGRPRSETDPRAIAWSAADGAVLRQHYGAHWQRLLTPRDPPQPPVFNMTTARVRTGFFTGASEVAKAFRQTELDFGDLAEIDNIDEVQPARAHARAHARADGDSANRNRDWTHTGAAAPVYTDAAVYPEDTVYELRQKIHVATGIPLYRQHLFYYINEEGPAVPYRISMDGAPVVVDWRMLSKSHSEAALIAGLPFDPRMEERRDGLVIEALDTFTLISAAENVRMTSAYVVDLYAVLPPLGSVERPLDNLARILRDRYQFDLLYYGALVRFWPQLSPDACNLALTEPARVRGTYPELDPNVRTLIARHTAEREIADRAGRWRHAAAKGARHTTAITAATVHVAPTSLRMRVAIRNVFDWVPTGVSVPAVAARFDIDSALISDAGAAAVGPEARLGGLIPVIARKRHASSYGKRSAVPMNWFAGKMPRRDTVAFAVARAPPSDEQQRAGWQQIPHAYVAISADGNYSATADWMDDDRMGFAAVTTEIAAVIAPTISEINSMGAAAFPIGGELGIASRESSAATTIGDITVSAFWPHAVSAATFRDIKTRFRAYEKAGIVAIRGLQQEGAYSFSFRKGVVSYDPRLAARAEAGARELARASAQNQYAWLTDSGVANRWGAFFHGRNVRIYHRATDLRVEIIGADSLAEFHLIRRYIFSFLDDLLEGKSRIRVGDSSASPTQAAQGPIASRRLRRLQERDPNLFDLKKYNQGATVYSVLCQSGRQPHVYSIAELNALSMRRRDALVQYWNFTENTPAFYECPDSNYPHLSFIASKHPKGYCLPCCKKSRPAAGSRSALINERCLAQRSYTDTLDDDDESAMSRHILTYGKTVPAGRISDVPREVSEGLLLGTLPDPYRLQLVGVNQNVPAIPDAGFAYALAYAIGVGSSSVEEVFTALAALAESMGDTYYALGGGGAAVFASATDLADAILGAFVRQDAALSPFGPGGAAAESWKLILSELTRYVYGVETVVLADASGTGTVDIEASAECVAALLNRSSGYTPPLIALIMTSPSGTYPVAALNPKFYLRVAPERRWMVARRTFSECVPELVDDMSEFVVDGIAMSVREALSSTTADNSPTLDLGLVSRYAASSASTFAVMTLLANMSNSCYGVILKRADGDLAYIPVRYSAYPPDGTPVQFGARPAVSLPHPALLAAVAELNRHISADGEAYSRITPAAILINADGDAIGFADGVDAARLHFYHDALDAPAARAAIATLATHNADTPKLPTINWAYDSREVDHAIVAAMRAPQATADAASALRTATRSRNQLYRMFLAEFAAMLRADRNGALRARIHAAIVRTNFADTQSVSALRRALVELLAAHPEDLQAVRSAVTAAYINAPHNPGAAAILAISASEFAFDRHTMVRLRALATHADVVTALKKLLEPRVSVVSRATWDQDPKVAQNMFVACSGPDAGASTTQCINKQLILPADRVDDLYDILAADVRNPSKTAQLSAVSAGVFDSLKFIRRPGEHLTITLGER